MNLPVKSLGAVVVIGGFLLLISKNKFDTHSLVRFSSSSCCPSTAMKAHFLACFSVTILIELYAQSTESKREKEPQQHLLSCYSLNILNYAMMLSLGLHCVCLRFTSTLFTIFGLAGSPLPALLGVLKVLLVVSRFEKVTLYDPNDPDSSPQAGTLADMETMRRLGKGTTLVYVKC